MVFLRTGKWIEWMNESSGISFTVPNVFSRCFRRKRDEKGIKSDEGVGFWMLLLKSVCWVHWHRPADLISRTCRRRRAAHGNGRARGTLLTSLRLEPQWCFGAMWRLQFLMFLGLRSEIDGLLKITWDFFAILCNYIWITWDSFIRCIVTCPHRFCKILLRLSFWVQLMTSAACSLATRCFEAWSARWWIGFGACSFLHVVSSCHEVIPAERKRRLLVWTKTETFRSSPTMGRRWLPDAACGCKFGNDSVDYASQPVQHCNCRNRMSNNTEQLICEVFQCVVADPMDTF